MIASFIIDFIGYVLSLVFSVILTAMQYLGGVLLKPFDFTTDMFQAVLGNELTNGIISFSITGGVTISIILLIWGLIRVFSGRFTDNVPNPLTLVIRFIIALVCSFWLITFFQEVLFPLAGTFLDAAFGLKHTDSLISEAVNNLSGFNIDSKLALFEAEIIMVSEGELVSSILAKIGTGVGTAMGITGLIILIIFLIACIAVFYNIVKLATESAERYFTVNLLVFTSPLASSTIVSEKSVIIFQSWFKLLLSNILTIIFNVIGFQMIIMAFSKSITAFTNAGSPAEFLVILLALVAVCRLVQKFDQLLAQITFKINPIQNRSLLMGALATFTAFDKTMAGLTGQHISGMFKNGINNMKNGMSNIARNSGFAPLRNGQLKRDQAVLGQNLEKAGFGKNSLQDDGSIKVGNALNNNSAKDLVDNANKALGAKGQKVTGFSGVGNNITLHTGDMNGPGGIGTDALESAFNNPDAIEGDYYMNIDNHGGSENIEYIKSQLPEGTYIAGKENLVPNGISENGVQQFTDRYYLTRDAKQASPVYHDKFKNANTTPNKNKS